MTVGCLPKYSHDSKDLGYSSHFVLQHRYLFLENLSIICILMEVYMICPKVYDLPELCLFYCLCLDFESTFDVQIQDISSIMYYFNPNSIGGGGYLHHAP